MMYSMRDWGSIPEQEGGTDPFPVDDLREVSYFITMKGAEGLPTVNIYPHQP